VLMYRGANARQDAVFRGWYLKFDPETISPMGF
jgi:hypothetical protein